MDIAFYLTELLGELGRVIVPGLGTFTRQKIAGYYNEQEAKFYPPGSEIIFDPHYTDDDTFAAYVGQQKKISLASSKYFIDKYISKMKTEAENRDIPFGELGSLHYEESGLSFTKAKTLKDDPTHYGYPQIEWPQISKISSPQYTETHAEAAKEEIPAPALKDEPEAISTTPSEAEQSPVQQDEAVKQSVGFDSEMEDYLRELEGGAYIAGPEATAHEPIAEPEPVPGPENEPVAEEDTDEQFAPEVPIDVALPGYTPGPVITEPAAEEHTPEPEPYIPPVAPVILQEDVSHHEEEFVFDGKGYDDVDTRPAEKRNRTWLWILLAIIVVAAGIGGFIYYKHKQALLKYQNTAIKIKPVLKPDTSKKAEAIDSLNDDSAAKDSEKNGAVKDTANKGVAAPVVVPSGTTTAIDSTKPRYELIGTSARTIAEANLRVTNYKSLGISDAHMLLPTPGMGRLIKISLATYNNDADAVNKKRELLNTGNVRDIEIIKIKPKK